MYDLNFYRIKKGCAARWRARTPLQQEENVMDLMQSFTQKHLKAEPPLHVTHLFSENSLYPLYLIKPARANAFRWLRCSEVLHFCKISGRRFFISCTFSGFFGLWAFSPYIQADGQIPSINYGGHSL